MLTPQDIRDKGLNRAVRGYDMKEVDEFLEEIYSSYIAVWKERDELSSKVKVLSEKIEEYRQTEDSMRLALLSVQQQSAQMQAEAQAKSEKMLSDAKAAAGKMLSDARNSSEKLTRETKANIANELAKFSEAQKATQKYVDHMTAVCQKQIEFYNRLTDARLVAAVPVEEVVEETAPEAAEAEEETVRAIEKSAEKAALAEPEENIPLDVSVSEEEPTRTFSAEEVSKKTKHSEYAFDDED